jgi:hypothetical protein
MAKYAVFPSELAKEIVALFRKLQRTQAPNRDTVEDLLKRIPRINETPIFFRNDSGYDCPAYACMQVVGTVTDGGQSYVKIKRPADVDATAGEYLFNGHNAVPDGEFGTTQGGGRLLRGIKASGTATAGDKWRPVVGDWTIEKEATGRFEMAGDDDIATDVARVFIGGGGGGSGATIQFTINSLSVAGSSSPYNGLNIANVTVTLAPCSMASLIGSSVDVVDWSGCVFDISFGSLVGVWGWASEYIGLSRQSGVDSGTLTPCHWGADDRCCVGGG